ncbi:MAG: integration host factor subunit alpha [Myxococcaceae bacterium]|nr:integration host factor subunit alpha [Myxococcaceae bacterium]
MTKADIIEGVYEKVGFSKKESAEIVELVFDTLKETLERGDKIKISGFGNFQVRQKKARVGRNPQTGKEIEISARRVLTFRPSQVLKSALNGEAPPENHAEIDAREEEADEHDEFDESDEQDFVEEEDGKP